MNASAWIDPFAVLLLTASVAAWWWAVRRWHSGGRVVAPARRSPVPWGLIDVIVTVLLLAALQQLAGQAVQWRYDLPPGLELHELPSRPRSAMLLAGAAASLATMILSCGWLVLRTGARWKDVGWWGRFWKRDTAIGLVVFLLVAPFIYGLQWCLTRLWPTQHPLIVVLMKEPDDRFFLVSVLVAVGIAPIVEEYFYRVVLQGWLERVSRFRGDPIGIFFGRPWSGTSQNPGIDDSADRPGTHEGEHRGYETSPRVPTNGIAKDVSPHGPRGSLGAAGGERLRPRDVPRWPVVVSSLLFAASHLSHGPDPIPLFFVGLVLGSLYRRTHRVLPCIVFHAALNGFSLAALYWSLSQ